MTRVIHADCGKVAFYFREKLKPGDLICSENVVLKDGTSAEPESPIICGTCHRPFNPNQPGALQQEHWTDWFIPDEEI